MKSTRAVPGSALIFSRAWTAVRTETSTRRSTLPARRPAPHPAGRSLGFQKPAGWTQRSTPTVLLGAEEALLDLGDDGEVGVDDVGDVVFEGVSHEERRAALVEAVFVHQPGL